MAYLAAAGLAAGAVYCALPNPSRPPTPYIRETAETLVPYKAGQRVWSTDPADGLEIKYAASGPSSHRYGTVPELLDKIANGPLGGTAAMKIEKAGYPADKEGDWETISWREYRDRSVIFAKALIGSGHKPFQGVAICGTNGPYWFVAHLGSTYAVGLSAGTYTTNTADACKFVADHSNSHIVVVDTVKTLKRYLTIKMDSVKHIVVACEKVDDAIKAEHGDYVLNWDEFLAKGKDVTDAQLTERRTLGKPNQASTLIYTSGTTGSPKAVMVSHDSLQFSASAAVTSALPLEELKSAKQFRYISYLPLSHIAAQMLDVILPMFLCNFFTTPYCVYFARPDVMKGSLALTLKAVRPTFFFGVPRVWEKLAEGIKAKAKATPPTGLKLKLVQWAKRIGLQCSENRQVGGSGHVPKGYTLADKLIFSKVKEALGLDQTIAFVTAAAPIQRETLNYFAALGIDITEIYGMSESTGNGTCGRPSSMFKFGCCGAPMVGQEMKLDHDKNRDKPGEGEICYRGRHVMMGYLKNEEKTREAIDAEGWLHSGDVGAFDENQQLRITGRIKELIITAGGENLAPVPIEDEIKKVCPALSNAVMIGDKRKYNTVLVSIKARQNLETGEFTDELAGDALEINPAIKTVSEARTDPIWAQYIESGIKKYNNGPVCVSNAQKIQKFRVLPIDLSIPGGELTGTLKIKRMDVNSKYIDLIEEMYQE